jgi:CheY-like chemotaxis protein
MPGEDGYALMKRIRHLDRASGGLVPSIALTAYSRAEDRQRALSAGFNLHLAKPVSPGDLLTAISNLANHTATLEL